MDVTDVGIHAIQTYFPKNYITQEDLEKYNEVKPGLKQLEMGFCYDNEDINSIALTVTARLMETYNIAPDTIGFLCVGTETLVDKSKSVKTQLMQLFGENTDIEGVDACFGGTQALLHAIDWIYLNHDLDKRLAIVVMADIAVYEQGSARPTGGAGAIALLIGPNAPIVLERGLRSFHMSDTKDFYKPIGGVASQYPKVDGELSLKPYVEAVDKCYASYSNKVKDLAPKGHSVNDFYALLFHAPFFKIVKEAYAKMWITDFEAGSLNAESVKELKASTTGERSVNKSSQELSVASSEQLFNSKTFPNMQLNRHVGKMYTPSLYAQLVTLISRVEEWKSLNDRRILLFSYGSGAASAMFSFMFKLDSETAMKEFEDMHDVTKASMKEFEDMHDVTKASIKLLERRTLHSPTAYTEAMTSREKLTSTEGTSSSEIRKPFNAIDFGAGHQSETQGQEGANLPIVPDSTAKPPMREVHSRSSGDVVPRVSSPEKTPAAIEEASPAKQKSMDSQKLKCKCCNHTINYVFLFGLYLTVIGMVAYYVSYGVAFSNTDTNFNGNIIMNNETSYHVEGNISHSSSNSFHDFFGEYNPNSFHLMFALLVFVGALFVTVLYVCRKCFGLF